MARVRVTLRIIVNLDNLSCVISGFHSSVNEICILLGFHTAENGCLLSMFQDNISIPSLRVQQFNSFCLDFLVQEVQ